MPLERGAQFSLLVRAHYYRGAIVSEWVGCVCICIRARASTSLWRLESVARQKPCEDAARVVCTRWDPSIDPSVCGTVVLMARIDTFLFSCNKAPSEPVHIHIHIYYTYIHTPINTPYRIGWAFALLHPSSWIEPPLLWGMPAHIYGLVVTLFSCAQLIITGRGWCYVSTCVCH
jgi:hypothetical protein